ncbi:ATP-binding protein [Streptomyces sp. NPDC029526]|uniref:sensor histidine kinase n=1 Tax=Streptomyces sp. NPDC029526 TaxID=3155728 RepID=UPI003410AC3D
MDLNAAVAAAAAIAGVLTGVIAMLAFRWSEREQRRPTRTSLHTEPVLPRGVDTVLSVLRSSAVVLDEADGVVKASSAAYALGLVRGGKLAVEPMLKMARDTRRDGEIRQVELDLPRRGTGRGEALAVSARVAPLGSRLVLLLVEDLTEARRIEAVRRDFVANVSHELKTPVGALSLLSEAVMDAADDPEAVERFAGRMQIEATRLTSLVQELIDLSRVQNDDPLEDSEPVRVSELVAEAIERCRHAAGTKEITMATNVGAGDGPHEDGDGTTDGAADLRVWGNRGQLAAALGNLVENAVNYSPARTRVGIAARSVRLAGGPMVEIAVTDQGIGISEKDKERVFERFYRVDPARSRATGGTGLGLSIVKHVAASHGGDVTVWSAEGQGSTFTLRLPEAPASRERASRTADETADETGEDTVEETADEATDGTTDEGWPDAPPTASPNGSSTRSSASAGSPTTSPAESPAGSSTTSAVESSAQSSTASPAESPGGPSTASPGGPSASASVGPSASGSAGPQSSPHMSSPSTPHASDSSAYETLPSPEVLP